MKGSFAFCAGAFAGFIVGSTKQGMAWRNDLDGHLNSLFGKCCNGSDEKSQSSNNDQEAEKEQPNAGRKEQKSSEKEQSDEKSEYLEESPMSDSREPLGMEKAKELAEKLGAKVSEPEGEEALPFSHPIETSTSRLSA
jgi:hypothetical protein